MFRYLFYSILFFTIIGCDDSSMNRKDIKVNTCIVDSISNIPVPLARVTILCWYNAGWDKTDFVSIDTNTNANGCIDVSFEEGYKVVVAGLSQDHAPLLVEPGEISGNKMQIQLKLKKRTNQNIHFEYEKFNLRDFIVQNTVN